MDTLLMIRERYPQLTAAEKRIADYVLDSGEEILEKVHKKFPKKLVAPLHHWFDFLEN